MSIEKPVNEVVDMKRNRKIHLLIQCGYIEVLVPNFDLF